MLDHERRKCLMRRKQLLIYILTLCLLLSSAYSAYAGEAEKVTQGDGKEYTHDSWIMLDTDTGDEVVKGQDFHLWIEVFGTDEIRSEVQKIEVFFNRKLVYTCNSVDMDFRIPYEQWKKYLQKNRIQMDIKYYTVYGNHTDTGYLKYNKNTPKICDGEHEWMINSEKKSYSPLPEDSEQHYVSQACYDRVCTKCGLSQRHEIIQYDTVTTPEKSKHQMDEIGRRSEDAVIDSEELQALGESNFKIVNNICSYKCNLCSYETEKTVPSIQCVGLTDVSAKWTDAEFAEQLNQFHDESRYKDCELYQIAARNTELLQKLIDYASKHSGEIIIPNGKYYFAPQTSYNRKKGGTVTYVIKCRDNVSIKGNNSILYPIGDSNLVSSSGNSDSSDFYQSNPVGIDMFYFNDYADKADSYPDPGSAIYLKDAHFSDFTIDGQYTSCAKYTTAGKGFMINLFQDCTWDNVDVMNTDGSGFGIDCPKGDSYLKGCTASGCGKAAEHKYGGGSGFGIGTGYSNDESLLIEDCRAYNNGKFGFFFEHQARFQGLGSSSCDESFYTNMYPATETDQILYTVKNCTATNNLYNFGGLMAYNTSYEQCYSIYDSFKPAESASNNSIWELNDKGEKMTWEDWKKKENNENVEEEKARYSGTQTPEQCRTGIFFGNDSGSDHGYSAKDLRSKNCSFSGFESYDGGEEFAEITIQTGSAHFHQNPETNEKTAEITEGTLWSAQDQKNP